MYGCTYPIVVSGFVMLPFLKILREADTCKIYSIQEVRALENL